MTVCYTSLFIRIVSNIESITVMTYLTEGESAFWIRFGNQQVGFKFVIKHKIFRKVLRCVRKIII